MKWDFHLKYQQSNIYLLTPSGAVRLNLNHLFTHRTQLMLSHTGSRCAAANSGWHNQKPSCAQVFLHQVTSATVSTDLKSPLVSHKQGWLMDFYNHGQKSSLLKRKVICGWTSRAAFSHQSIMWWAAHMYYLIYHLESAAALTSAAASYQLPPNQPERYITMWTPGLVWSSQWKSVKNGRAGMDAQIKSGLNAQTRHSLNVYFMIHSESLVSSEAHLSQQTQYMMTLMFTFSECVSKE